jgi:hypothetical protein
MAKKFRLLRSSSESDVTSWLNSASSDGWELEEFTNGTYAAGKFASHFYAVLISKTDDTEGLTPSE